MEYNAGSPLAQKHGCTCPILDNCYGKGAYNDKDGNPLFWFNEDCPLHGQKLTEKEE